MKNFYGGEGNESEMLKAILEESGMTPVAQTFVKGIYRKQQEIIGCLEELVRQNGWRQQSVERRLDELLAKIDPEEAKKRKDGPQCESSAGMRIPGKGLL